MEDRMKKIFILFILLALSLFAFNCGGGSGSSSSPKGENLGEPSIVQLLPAQFIAQTNSIITLHAKVLDGNGAPVKNIPVSFTNLSPIGTLSSTTAQTNSTGIASVTLKSTTSGFSTVQAEINKGVSQVRDRKTVFFSSNNVLGVTMSLDVDSVPGNGDDNTFFGYDEPTDFILFSPPPDPDYTVVVLATVRNAGGVRLAGELVQWFTDEAEATFIRTETETNANGQAKAIIKVTPESIRATNTYVNIMAFAGNGAASMVTLFLEPVVVESITVSANPQTVDSGGTSTITANVTSTAGTPVPDGTTVTFTTNKGGIEPFAQTTNGIATAEYTPPTVNVETTARITASIGAIFDIVDINIAGPKPLSVTPTVTINGAIGGIATLTVSGGTPAYTIASNDPAFPPVPTSVATSGGTFKVTVPTGTASKNVLYTVQDTKGQSATATLQITTAAGAMTVAPLSATICENNTTCSVGTTTATFTITGGTPTPSYNVTSDNIAVITSPGVLAGNTFTVDANAITADTIVTLTITDNAPTPATVTRTVTVVNQN
jgi:hypothetical protein